MTLSGAPLTSWLDRLTTQVNERYDRLDTYLDELQKPEPPAHDEREGGR